MYKINRLKKGIATVAIIMGCVLTTSISAGATPANKTPAATPTSNAAPQKAAPQKAAPQKAASADNSLKAIKLSEGTLSPKFAYNTVQYTATVGENTTSIDVNATVSDSTATVQSVSGNKELKEGANTVKVVVKAANGNLATYTIVVTRGGSTAATNNDKVADTKTADAGNTADAKTSDATQSTDPATVSGADGYTVSDNIPQSAIPADFTETDVTYQNAACKGLKFDKGDLVLLYMLDANSKGELFVYDQAAGAVYPFVKLANGDKYIIPLQTPSSETVDSAYTAADLAIDGKNVTGAYQTGIEDTADFYLVYAMNSDGKGGWYQYDKAEGTYQRYVASSTGDVTTSDQYKYLQKTYSDLSDKYNSLKDKDTKFIAGLIIALAIFLIVIVNLLLRGRRESAESDVEEKVNIKGDVFANEAKAERKDQKKKEETVKNRAEQVTSRQENVKNRRSEELFEEFDDKDEEAFADFEEEPDFLSRRKPKKEKKKKTRNEDVFESKKAKKDEEYYDDEEPLEEKKNSSSIDDDLEILDLNDL